MRNPTSHFGLLILAASVLSATNIPSPEGRNLVAQTGPTTVEQASDGTSSYRLGGFAVGTVDSRPQRLRLRISYNHRDVWNGSVDALKPVDLPIQVATDFAEKPKKGYARSDLIYLYIESQDYAAQWHILTKADGNLSLKNSGAVTLHRKKYAIVEYAFYPGDNPDFEGREPRDSGVAAVGHWGAIPAFGPDWQIWQGTTTPGRLWGDTLLLQFHRGTPENGLIEVPDSDFKHMQKAPDSGYVHHGACGEPSLAAKAGSSYYIRVVGHTQTTRGYGKIHIKEITETVPDGIEVIKR